jgi:hypothetical protein
MTTTEYFQHARNLGAFTAQDCIALARRAAELDRASELKKVPQPVVVWYEVNPDGTHARFSKGVTVY